MSILNALNHDEGAVVGLATVGLVIVSAIFAWLNFRTGRDVP